LYLSPLFSNVGELVGWIMWLSWNKASKHRAKWWVYVRKLTACQIYDGRLWIGVRWFKKGLVASCTVHVNEISFSSEYGEFVCSLQFLRLACGTRLHGVNSLVNVMEWKKLMLG
jgi:hypothetical protein